MNKMRPWAIPILLGAVSVLAYAGMVSMQMRHGNLGTTEVKEFLAWFGLAFCAYVAAVVWLERRWGPNGGGHALRGVQGFFLLAGIWGGGLLFRWILLHTYPTLSSDVFRYMWDGHVQVNGISPYAWPINASQLDHLDVSFRAQANHAWMASPYLPAAQWFFAFIAYFQPLNPQTFQTAAVLFDLTTAFVLSRLLAAGGLPSHRLLLYLWNPLVIVETAQGAHVDAFMVALAMLAVFTVWRGSGRRQTPAAGAGQEIQPRAFCALSPFLLALATLTKPVPLLLAPIFWRRWTWGSRLLYVYLSVMLLLSPALRAGWGLTGGLDGRGLFGAMRIYHAQWKFNGGLFHWLEEWLSQMGIDEPMAQAQEIALFFLFLLLLAVWLRLRGRPPDLRGELRWLAAPLAGYLLLSATVHPWYLLVILPFLPFLTPARDEPPAVWLWALPWLWLSGALALSYLTYLDPANLREFEWVRRLEWLPAVLLLVYATLRRDARRPLGVEEPTRSPDTAAAQRQG